MKEFDTLVYIGRFQPLHIEHLNTINRASWMANKIIIIVGSSDRSRNYKNPWNYSERQEMIANAIMLSDNYDPTCEYEICPNHDTIYDDYAWADRIDDIVKSETEENEKIGIIGYEKDESSFYLNMFPYWGFVPQEGRELHATDIRNIYFNRKMDISYLAHVLPHIVYSQLVGHMDHPTWEQMVSEYEYIQKYKDMYKHLPYGITFIAADALVLCGEFILLVERGGNLGKGQLAMPGGFIDAEGDSSLVQTALRELQEETGLELLLAHYSGSQVFDGKDRSSRGRTITQVSKFELNKVSPPYVRAADDAAKADWHVLSDLKRKDFFEDHYEIIQNMTKEDT